MIQVKIKYLTEFHETALVDRAWKLEGVGEGDERMLLERFSSVTTVFQSLSERSQEVRVYCPNLVHACRSWLMLSYTRRPKVLAAILLGLAASVKERA